MLQLYRSSAGSGKTYTLALYYVALLIEKPQQFSQILAVTFTNKATREMKDRILEFLDKLSQNADAGLMHNLRAQHQRLQQLGEDEIQSRAQEALSAILHDYSRFSVTTLDSFFQYMLQGFARELRLPLSMELELDLDRVTEHAVDGLLEEAGNDATLTDWLTDMLRAQMDDDRGWRIKQGIRNLGKQLFQESFQEIAPEIPAANEEELSRLQSYIKKGLQAYVWRENKTRFLEQRARIEAIVREWETHNLEADDFFQKRNGPYSYITRLAQANRLTETAPPGKYVNDCIVEPTKLAQKSSQRALIQERAPAWMATVQDVVEKLDEKRPHLLAVDNILKKMYAYGLLSYLQQQIKLYRDQYELSLISDAPKLIEELRKNAGTEFIYEKAGARYQHFLLDEFQDTNQRQWENMFPLLEEAFASGGTGLIVGDAKQSIYRWRGGNMHLLQSEVAEKFRHVGLEESVLETNRRSTARIVHFNNALFERLPEVLGQNPPQDGDQLSGDALKAYQDVAQKLTEKTDPGGHLDIRLKPKMQKASASQEEEDDASEEVSPDDAVWQEIIGIISSLKDGQQSLADIGILVRRRADAILAARKLIEAGIPVVSEESLLLKSSPKVALIIAMMSWLDGRSRDLHAAEVAYLYEAHLQESAAAGPSPEAVRKPPEAVLEALLKSGAGELELSALMPHELVEMLVRRFGLDAMGPDSFLVQFQNLVREAEGRGANSLTTFLEEWEAKGQNTSIALPEALEAVRVLTIHKAKGLQFDTVILPYADWQLIDLKANESILWAPDLDREPFQKEIVAWHPFQPTKNCIGSVLEAPYRHERNELLADSLNMLYVATTRAERQLIMWARHKKKTKEIANTGPQTIGDLLYLALPELPLAEEELLEHSEEELRQFTLGECCAKATAKKSEEELALWKPQAYRSVHWSEVVKIRRHGSPVAPRLDALENPRRRGLLYHQVLERMETRNELSQALDQLQREGRIGGRALRDALESRLEALLARPEWQPWFAPGWTVYNEADLLAPTGVGQASAPNLRPDRLMVGTEQVVVIDYKTGAEGAPLPLPKHHRQMEAYLNAARAIFPQHQLEGYLLYLDAEQHFPVEAASSPG